MKNLLIFLAGVLTGILGVAFYELFVIPVEPTPDMDETQPIEVDTWEVRKWAEYVK